MSQDLKELVNYFNWFLLSSEIKCLSLWKWKAELVNYWSYKTRIWLKIQNFKHTSIILSVIKEQIMISSNIKNNNNQTLNIHIRSVQFSRSVMSNSLQPHELQHARPPCSSPTPGVHSDSHPLNQWCHPAISSSGVPFSSWPQSLPASESFPMSQFFTWGG